MPIIKIFGFSENNSKAEKIRHKIDEAMGPAFKQGETGTVLIHSDCRVCDPKSEKYEYLEVIFRFQAQKDIIIATLKDLHLELDVVFIRLDEDGFIPADEMV